ncbi:MAG: methionyl-tRNA formyltransferase [Myxococcota bacterium]
MRDVPRVVFMGTPEFASPILEAMVRSGQFEVVGLVSQPDRRAGRGRKLASTPTKRVAEANGVPVFQPTKLKTEATRAMLAELRADVAIVAAYGRILPAPLLTLPRFGCLNVHASLLPRHRGASPIAHAILAGDRDSGVCLMQMDEGLDTGPVFSRRIIAIAPTDTTASLGSRLSELGAQLVVDDVPRVLRGELKAVAQPEGDATYAPLLKKQDGRLDFSENAIHLERAVRAYQPWPVAFFEFEGERIQAGRAEVDDREGEPGVVLEVSGKGVRVGCGEGSLWLLEVKPPSKRMMPAQAWVAGRAIREGVRFGTSAGAGR